MALSGGGGGEGPDGLWGGCPIQGWFLQPHQCSAQQLHYLTHAFKCGKPPLHT